MSGKWTLLVLAALVAALMVCGCTSTSPEGQTPSPTEVTTTVPAGETETVTETMTETAMETETVTGTETMAENETGTGNETGTADDIVAVATDAGTFTTLLTALDAADLTTVLQEEGPYTVFAPNDAAFEALPAGTLDDLMANTTDLTSVLQYHVVPGEYDAVTLEGYETLETLEGEMLNISVADGVVTVDNATVVTADIEASNGIIHEIDAVMLPPSVEIVEETAENETTENESSTYESTENETTET